MRRVARRHGERDHIGDRQLWVRLDEIHARVRIRARKGDARRVAGPNVEPELSSPRRACQQARKRTKVRCDRREADVPSVSHRNFLNDMCVGRANASNPKKSDVLWHTTSSVTALALPFVCRTKIKRCPNIGWAMSGVPDNGAKGQGWPAANDRASLGSFTWLTAR